MFFWAFFKRFTRIVYQSGVYAVRSFFLRASVFFFGLLRRRPSVLFPSLVRCRNPAVCLPIFICAITF